MILVLHRKTLPIEKEHQKKLKTCEKLIDIRSEVRASQANDESR